MLNFGNLHPKVKKQAQKEAMKLYALVTQVKEPDFSQPRTLDFHSRRKGHVELPVRVLHNKVTDLRGQVIIKVTA